MVIFEIKGVSSSDYGVYTCTASNKFGTAMSRFELRRDSQFVEQRPKFTSQLQVFLKIQTVNNSKRILSNELILMK
jgi:hypothetical protein